MNYKELLKNNIENTNFFFWCKKLSKGTEQKELWKEVEKIENEIKRLQLKRDKLGTLSVIISNNKLRNKQDLN